MYPRGRSAAASRTRLPGRNPFRSTPSRNTRFCSRPYDVRYGDFSGALINTVTKSGTNAIQGSAFAFARNDRLARHSGPTAATPYDRAQYGLSLGGPIVPNRLHFFVASELQRFTYPAAGPYVGQPASADRPVPVGVADLDRFDAIMRSYGLTAGSAGPVENGNPLRNLFTRLDLALPSWNSRVVVWNNYSSSGNIAFSRAARDTFSLSSFQTTSVNQTRTTAVQLHTTLSRAGGGHNELLISNRSDGFDPVPAVQQPIVRVSVPSVSGARITLNSGTPQSAQATALRPSAFSVSDNVTLPLAVDARRYVGRRRRALHLTPSRRGRIVRRVELSEPRRSSSRRRRSLRCQNRFRRRERSHRRGTVCRVRRRRMASDRAHFTVRRCASRHARDRFTCAVSAAGRFDLRSAHRRDAASPRRALTATRLHLGCVACSAAAGSGRHGDLRVIISAGLAADGAVELRRRRPPALQSSLGRTARAAALHTRLPRRANGMRRGRDHHAHIRRRR